MSKIPRPQKSTFHRVEEHDACDIEDQETKLFMLSQPTSQSIGNYSLFILMFTIQVRRIPKKNQCCNSVYMFARPGHHYCNLRKTKQANRQCERDNSTENSWRPRRIKRNSCELYIYKCIPDQASYVYMPSMSISYMCSSQAMYT